MEKAKDDLKEIISKWDTTQIVDLIDKCKGKMKLEEINYRNSSLNLKEEVENLEKQIERLNAEFDVLNKRLEKTREKYTQKHTERFHLYKKIAEYEQDHDDLSEKVINYEKRHKEIENEINKATFPSMNVLFLHLMKLSGVEFVDKDKKKYARVKNREKNDIIFIDIDHENTKDISENIWKNINPSKSSSKY